MRAAAVDPRASRRVRSLCGVLTAILGTLALLALTFLIGQQTGESLGHYVLYQVAGLVVAVIVVVVVRVATGVGSPSWGSMAAPSRAVRALGIGPSESWRAVGRNFTIVISLVTAGFLALSYGTELAAISLTSWLLALLVAVPLSATNALTEELVTRWAVVASLSDSWPRLAPWASAAVFGSVHWFGIPGGPMGAAMAGFLGWLLARSIQDTRGIGWAWIVHFSQDVLIFTVTIALFI